MKKKWWHNKVAYEIYPKSFYDSNGDGIGDLPGIISKLDYLKDLGVDILWICPIYESPFVDQGYDISDYYKIAECFGTMEDFETLMVETKKRDMYVIMDLVINHCSDKHEWFQKALLNPDSEYAKCFYFEKGRDGKEPSNYRSHFGGNMWSKVDGYEDLYYYHSFAKEQPDLNWNNPKVLEYLYGMVNWWLDKGLAGFRVDAIINIKKDITFPCFEADGPDGLCHVDKVIKGADGHGGKTVGQMLQDLKNNTYGPRDCLTVGEVFNKGPEDIPEFVGDEGHFSTIFDFGPHLLTNCENGWYVAKEVLFKDFRRTVIESQLRMQDKTFMANVLENHDEPRSVDIYLPKWMDREQGAKLLATVLIMEHGIPFLYQGEEIGMTNKDFTSMEEFNDINTKDQYHQAMERGKTAEEALAICNKYSRDNARTPMQWNDSYMGGFTTGTPWFAMNENYSDINVERQLADENSILNFYRRIIALKKNPIYEDALCDGLFAPANSYMDQNENVFAFYRKGEKYTFLVLMNWGKEAVQLKLENGLKNATYVLFGDVTHREREGKNVEHSFSLEGCETAIIRIENSAE